MDAWFQRWYVTSGELKASYDANSGVLSGKFLKTGEIRFVHAENRFSGTFEPGEGRAKVNLVFEKAVRRDVYEAAANNPPQRLRAKPESRIVLLYIGAEDCPYCKAWERDRLQGGLLTNMPEFKKIEFLTSKRLTLHQKAREADLPKGTEQYYPMLEKNYSKALTLSPSFVVLVNDQVRMSSPADSWIRRFIPRFARPSAKRKENDEKDHAAAGAPGLAEGAQRLVTV